MTEEAAMETLFRAALDEFVAVRKQLSSQLNAAGDAAAAGRVAKLKRPTVSVWAVNQLWWQEREAFETLFASARRVSAGELSVAAEHRRVLGELREAGGRLLADAGHSANEATLRRIQTTLASLAALGGFEPDRPGALQRDRDPPGFEALALPLASSAAPSGRAEGVQEAATESSSAEAATQREAAAREAATRQEAAREARARETAARAARAKIMEERKRVERELAEARRVCDRRRVLVDDLSERLQVAERELASSQEAVTLLEQRLAALQEP